MTEFSARFSLFPSKEKKSEKSPDTTGNIEVAVDQIQSMISYLQTAEREQDYQGNDVVKIRLAAWNTTSKGGMAYQSGKVSPPMANTAPQAVAAPVDANCPF
jgi:hypothetical protein